MNPLDVTQRAENELAIARIIEGHVGYETPIQWRIAKSLAVREDTIRLMAPVGADNDTFQELKTLHKQVELLAMKLDKLPRWRPVWRTDLVLMYNESMGLTTPRVYRWWQYRPTLEGPMDSLVLTMTSLCGVLFIFELIRQLVLAFNG